MLSQQENDILCRVGPATPMGELMRQYWIPALMSHELSEPDCPPIRLRLLSENMIAFRATSGAVGIIQDACPHRGASMFFGRNEQDGLRCVYHGWKFDVTGACVDMPSEPTESNFKNKVRTRAYPCVERNGVIWTYMGCRTEPPPMPMIEANMLPDGQYTARKVMRDCNWIQALEGDIDTVHAGFLHYGSVPGESVSNEDVSGVARHGMDITADKTPRYMVADMPYGTMYGAYRPSSPTDYYWRIASFFLPFYTRAPGNPLPSPEVQGSNIGASVPIDDDHTMRWQMSSRPIDPAAAGPESEEYYKRLAEARRISESDRRGGEMLPDDSGWLGKFRLAANAGNDYRIDREVQRSAKTKDGYTGLAGTLLQDQGITESMGPIVDRTIEHLGTSDAMIIRTRRRAINAALALRDDGVVPEGVDNPSVFAYRNGWIVLPQSEDWLEATRERREAFVKKVTEAAPTLTVTI